MRTARVIVLPYDPAWAAAFEQIKTELVAALGELIVGVEHIGSTAVEGLAAKPCIDLDVVIRDVGRLDAVVAGLAEIGYVHEGDLGIKGREAFRYEGKPHLYRHHLYVCAQDAEELRRHLTFRDFLRTHPQARAEYGEVKLLAAAMFPHDIDAYMAHKGPCVEALYTQCGLTDKSSR